MQKAGDSLTTETRKDEQERGITIKSTGVTLYYQYSFKDNGEKEPILVNLIDSPGHVDFSPEVTAALRVTDGAVVVVDFIEGVRVQTETVLRQALQEKIRPVLMINKADRGIHELQLTGEEMYQKFVKIIENANITISTYQTADMNDCQLDPKAGTVAFGSAYYGWAFTIPQMAKIYAKKFSVPVESLVEKLWGEHYYDTVNKKWQTNPEVEGRPPLKRAFCAYIMDPIIKLSKALHDRDTEVYTKLLGAVGVTITKEDKESQGREFTRKCFQKWIMVADALLEMIVLHLPSPKEAQVYRCPYLYQGPQDDSCATAIRNCDSNGPLMVYISKMVPGDKGRLFSFGRVFSGTISAGQQVRIMGSNYNAATGVDFYIKNVTRIVLMMGRFVEQVPYVPCGNTIGLVGIDQFLTKNGTLSDCVEACPIRCMKYSVSPVVRVAVNPKNPADLPKLIEGLKMMVKTDPLVLVTREESGSHIISGCGELHIEICLHDLVESYAKIEIVTSEPVVSYKETVTGKSSQICLAKSANKLNRVFCQAEPLPQDLVDEIESGRLGPKEDAKTRSKILNTKFGWDATEAKRLWVFGPEDIGANILVDQTKAATYLQETRSGFESAFGWVTKEGALSEEELRGVRMNILDVAIHSDPAHRGSGQIIQMARRSYYGSLLSAQPRMQEPIYIATITCPTNALGGVYSCVAQRRGMVINEEPMTGTPLSVITSYLPIAESFGFIEHLRSLTSGQAFAQCTFDHWEMINQDPYDTTSKVSKIISKIRERKGMQAEIPVVENYVDKL
jgi:elongation factor 2